MDIGFPDSGQWEPGGIQPGCFSIRRIRDNKTSKDILHLLLAKKIRFMIEEFQPHTIVCTHPFPASVVSELKNRGLHIPMAGVITDYDLHALWVDQKIDHYIFGDQKLQDSFAQFGFKPPSASFEGIPVDPVFDRETDKDELKTRLQFFRIMDFFPACTVRRTQKWL